MNKHYMDWADCFIESIYRPVFGHVFTFKGLLVGEKYLRLLEQECNITITCDYINFKAWVAS